MSIVGAFDVHRRQLTFDYLDIETGEVRRGRIVPADREHLRAWLARFAGRDDVRFAVEGCTGWRYVGRGAAGRRDRAAPGRARRHRGAARQEAACQDRQG